jgi:RNA polymerase sigma-70 factor (ECF subfamily)
VETTRTAGEAALARRLQEGDGAAFSEIVHRHHASMVRVASTFVRSRPEAEDVVQETWLAVVKGVAGFEGRSSLRSWIFAILVNKARTHAVKESRSAASPLPVEDLESGAGGVPADRFVGRPGRGAWRDPVADWQDDPQLHLESAQTLAVVLSAVEDLPPRRRQVLVLRDVEGWSAAEVAELLDISDGNQRVLLHRARNALRLRLEKELGR